MRKSLFNFNPTICGIEDLELSSEFTMAVWYPPGHGSGLGNEKERED